MVFDAFCEKPQKKSMFIYIYIYIYVIVIIILILILILIIIMIIISKAQIGPKTVQGETPFFCGGGGRAGWGGRVGYQAMIKGVGGWGGVAGVPKSKTRRRPGRSE